MHTVSFVPTFDSWRAAARERLGRGVEPDAIVWLPLGGTESSAPVTGSLFESCGTAAGLEGAAQIQGRMSEGERAEALARFRVPQQFLDKAKYVSFHRDDAKWTLLYRLLWRLAYEDARLLEHFTDPDVLLFNRMHKAVWIEEHKMHAFVRFRRVEREGVEAYVAWYRPVHPLLRLGVEFFVRRFGAQNWVLHTDVESAYWNGSELTFGAGLAVNPFSESDDLEVLWRTYYGAIFNPARLNVELLRRKIPTRLRRELPETVGLEALIAEAPARAHALAALAQGSALPFLPPPSPASGEVVLPQLAEAAEACRGCSLWSEATRVVFGRGHAHARLAVVGEQPGDEEDRKGEPFVGPAGKILDEALHVAGLSREDLYVTNAVKHFKYKREGKRRIHQKPAPREVAACRPWLERELQTLRPKVLLLLGATAAQSLLGRVVGVERERGIFQPSRFCENTIVTFHPSAILRAPNEERRVELFSALVDDLVRAKVALEGDVRSREAMPVPSSPTPSHAKAGGAVPASVPNAIVPRGAGGTGANRLGTSTSGASGAVGASDAVGASGSAGAGWAHRANPGSSATHRDGGASAWLRPLNVHGSASELPTGA